MPQFLHQKMNARVFMSRNLLSFFLVMCTGICGDAKTGQDTAAAEFCHTIVWFGVIWNFIGHVHP